MHCFNVPSWPRLSSPPPTGISSFNQGSLRFTPQAKAIPLSTLFLPSWGRPNSLLCCLRRRFPLCTSQASVRKELWKEKSAGRSPQHKRSFLHSFWRCAIGLLFRPLFSLPPSGSSIIHTLDIFYWFNFIMRCPPHSLLFCSIL